uniref:Tyr recombinase domain-containing protein n=1 Tax=Photinus pyralis TaxID=7054 RepID=A0A1Y1LFP4_PHOPY
MRGISNLRPALPKYNITWDPKLLLVYLKGLFPTESLSLKFLNLKLATLLALITGHRLQTISLIRPSNIKVSSTGYQVLITDKLKTSSSSSTPSSLHIPLFSEEPALCVASLLKRYLVVTSSFRSQQADFLFLTHQRPHREATKQTISRWVKLTMELAGLDTSKFKPHSTRHASTSTALKRGVPLATILKTAGWSRESNTFRNFYNLPITDDMDFAVSILQAAR